MPEELVSGPDSGSWQAMKGILLRKRLRGRHLNVKALEIMPRHGPTAISSQAANDQFVNVVGTSVVRSFGADLGFFPIMVATGKSSFVADDRVYSDALARYETAIRRLAPGQDLLIALGGDPKVHKRNDFGTRPGGEDVVTAADRRLLRKASERYCTFAHHLSRQCQGRIALLAALPTFDPLVNQLTTLFNELLRKSLPRIGVQFLDVASELSDPATGLLRIEYSSCPEHQDLHPSWEALKVIKQHLSACGMGPKRWQQGTPTCVWRSAQDFELRPGARTRIWPDPALATASQRLAATFAVEAAWRALLPEILHGPAAPRILVVNALEGMPAYCLPFGLAREIRALCSSEQELLLAHRVRAFLGREDVTLGTVDAESADGFDADVTVGLVHPDSASQDLDLLQRTFSFERAGRLFVIASKTISANLSEVFKTMPRMMTQLGNRHLAPAWRKTALFEIPRGT